MRGALGRGLKERGWGAGGGGRCRQARPVGRRSHLDQRGELPRFPSEARDPARHQRLRVRAPLQRYGAPRCDVRPRSAASSAPPGSPPCAAVARPAPQFQRMRGGTNSSASGSRPDLLVRRPCSTRPVIWGQSLYCYAIHDHSAPGRGCAVCVVEHKSVWSASAAFFLYSVIRTFLYSCDYPPRVARKGLQGGALPDILCRRVWSFQCKRRRFRMAWQAMILSRRPRRVWARQLSSSLSPLSVSLRMMASRRS